MSEMIADDNIGMIQQLRNKTEEVDLSRILKSTFGGYTRKSVMEYLSALKKQQQATADTFYQNIQALFSEKEELNKTNNLLQARLKKTEAEYQKLSDALLINKMETGQYALPDILALKDNIAALEEEQKRLKNIIAGLERKTEQQKNTNQDLALELEQAKSEINAQKEMIMTQKLEAKKQYDTITELTSQLEAEQDQNRYLMNLTSEGELAQLKSKVNELSDQLIFQSEIIAKQNEEDENKQRTIDNLLIEIDSLEQSIGSLTKSLEDLKIQNESLSSANKTFIAQLEEEYKKELALIREKSNINAEKLTALKKLSEANYKISTLELELQKKYYSEELSRIALSQNEGSDQES